MTAGAPAVFPVGAESGHTPGRRRTQFMLNLHRLENDQQIAGAHMVAGPDLPAHEPGLQG